MSIIAQEIFKAYDIRGIIDQTLSLDATSLIGKALATVAIQKNISCIALGRDGRLSGESFLCVLADELTEAGIDVFDVGMVTTPMLYFAALTHTDGNGLMITGSHNPANYNGFKIMLQGMALSGDDILALYHIIENDDFIKKNKIGTLSYLDIAQSYEDKIASDIKPKRTMTLAIDAGNGVAGAYAGALYRRLGFDVIELFCEVDGHFPNHHPDPAKPANLKDLIECLNTTDAEIGLAFDGDGDRLGVVTKKGEIIWPDRQLMLFSQDILQNHPNAPIIFDVKCTRLLGKWIEKHGGRPILSKTGHSFIKKGIKEHQALLAGEMSGHLFFADRWLGFDDGLYAGARLLEILSNYSDINDVLNNLPNALNTPEINIEMAKEGENHALIALLQKEVQKEAVFEGAENVITLDGLRVEYPDGFGLIRASNTTPVLVLRFEADNENSLNRIQTVFQTLLAQYGIRLNI